MAPHRQERRFTLRRRLTTGGCIVILGYVAWWLAAYPRGMLTAWLDHARGHYEIQAYGLPPPWYDEYARLLRDRYGVKIDSVAGESASWELVKYVDGYNAVSRPRIEAHFGTDIFKECGDEVLAAWERTNPGK